MKRIFGLFGSDDETPSKASSFGAWKTVATAALVFTGIAGFLTGCPAPQEKVQLHGQVRLTLIHTSDLHSRLFPYSLQVGQADSVLGLGTANNLARIGGAAKVSHIVNRERARADRVLHLDGGDCFQGAPVFNFFNGEAEIRSLSQMGTDAMVIANHEFDRGAGNAALQIQNWADFPVLAANYNMEDFRVDGNAGLGKVLQPFTTFNLDGLRVAVIGFGNLSSMTSLFETPNKNGIQPLNTVEVAQFYTDLLRPHVDVIVLLTHLGLEVDQQLIEGTTGVDVVLGGHNHIVLQPPKLIQDCARVDKEGHHFIEVADGQGQSTDKAPTMIRRYCDPRSVLLAHSGAFAKFVGRLDLMMSNDKEDLPATYDPINGFELVSHAYRLFPVTDDVPEDPLVNQLLEPYKQGLDALLDLDMLIGYAPNGSARSSTNGGDSELGNLVATSMWLRLGIQTDLSMTNTTGVRADMVPGPVSVEQLFNIFPFDNSITKMQLSGVEVEQMFDFIARRSAGRGCKSQAQIAGARIVINCAGCTRPDPPIACTTDVDCSGSTCEKDKGTCKPQPCAEHIYIGATNDTCKSDADCYKGEVGSCEMGAGKCWRTMDRLAAYELATSNYLASGGSGFRVLQRNTTQLDTKIEMRDALIDYVRAGHPCGWSASSGTSDGLKACATDAECAGIDGDFTCACPEASKEDASSGTCRTEGTCGSKGRCVKRSCRNEVAEFHRNVCRGAPNSALRDVCEKNLGACQLAGESCKFLACIDKRLGNYTDDRLLMQGR